MRKPSPTLSEDRERWQLLRQLDTMLELPMIVLGFCWLALLIFELTIGLTSFWQAIGTTIWAVFVLDFAMGLLIAPEKTMYWRRNWLGAVSLLVPALRIFRIARAFRLLRLTRAVRAVRFASVLGAVNRGMRSLRATMRRRGLGYVIGITVVVALAGAAGMYAFEHDVRRSAGFETYGSSLWWTLMILTSMGSEYWPRTGAGRALCLLLSTYGFAVFGYITAALASYFVGRDAEQKKRASPAAART